MNKKSGPFLLLLLIGSLIATAVLTPTARANTIDVTTSDDEVNSDGDCSLREAVIAANTDTAVDACTAGAGDDIISVPPGTYLLSLTGAGEDAAQTGDLDLLANVTINGAGQGQTIIDGNGADRVFNVWNNVTVHISGVTIQNGSASLGGGIAIGDDGQLFLNYSRVTGNTATSDSGGGIGGGGFTIINSRIDGNHAASSGGGIFVNFEPVVISNSEISGNSAGASGGGIASTGTLAVVNSTLSGNSADRDGGGLFAVENPNNALYNVTISDNTADADGDDVGEGGGVRTLGGLITVANTLIGGNVDNSSGGNQQHDCAATLDSEGYNLIADVTGCTINGDLSGNLLGVDPLLGPLQNNGGATLTHALLENSPAIDAGNPGGCRDQDGNLLTTDQRGSARPAGGSSLCDIGAYEAGDPGPPTPTPTATVSPTPDPAQKFIYLPVIVR
ncbi:MAG TPA: CSLREA domain-containing protein [Anaerolineae bacterium]